MIRVSYILWLAFFMALIIALFQVKYTVQQVGERRDATIRQIDETKERVRKLQLEWEALVQRLAQTLVALEEVQSFVTEQQEQQLADVLLGSELRVLQQLLSDSDDEHVTTPP